MSDSAKIISRDSLPTINNLDEEDELIYDMTKTVDENYLAQVKSCVPLRTMRMLTPRKIDAIVEHVRDGMSLSTAGASVGVVPTTLGNYLADGKKDYEALTDEDFDDVDDPEDALTEKAKFFIEVSQARGECIINLHNILMDKAAENGKEWIPQWLLQVMEPETYSLKYRTERMKLEAKANEVNATIGKIEFVFIDGYESRKEEEKSHIETKLEELERKWGKAISTDEIINTEYTIVDEDEEAEEDFNDLDNETSE